MFKNIFGLGKKKEAVEVNEEKELYVWIVLFAIIQSDPLTDKPIPWLEDILNPKKVKLKAGYLYLSYFLKKESYAFHWSGVRDIWSIVSFLSSRNCTDWSGIILNKQASIKGFPS